MAEEVILPKWGLTMDEGTVRVWLKQEGDTVTADEVIVEVETDKITKGKKYRGFIFPPI